MATTKITVTIPNEQIAEISALVAAGRSASTSAFVKHAISIALTDAAGWREMLDQALQQTGGLIALDRNDRRAITLLARAAEQGGRITIPATALA